ncbi:MAG: 16S rRNA (guanine(527)-N(7))-methyltransferase RsmG [Hydrogenophilaceae bacterium]|jgi:16S rRNA (guanine527-N7)-methyltransferase|nr:16S rRNA (guanine(527)-N(7))-methyltransferase RsmG [Hydrogenophilaceae bacterium]
MTDPSDRLRIDLGVSRETLERLETHRRLLAAWSPRVNLIGPEELQHYWSRHALDCAQLVRLAPGARLWLDLGAGAGFPGLVIAAVLAEEGGSYRVDLVERNAKKAAFLREAARAMGVQARVIHATLEAHDPQEKYDVVTARALAPLSRLIPHARPWLDRGALGLFPKGADYGSELRAAGFSDQGGVYEDLEADVAASVSDPRARIIRIRKRP